MRRAPIAAVLLVAACGGASTATPAATRTPQSRTAPAPAPSTTVPANCSPVSGGAAERARITDMRIGSAGGYDTLVIEFDNAVTHFELSGNPTGVQFAGAGGKGGTFTLAGTYGVRLNLFNLNWTVPPGDQYAHGTDLKQSAPGLQEARQIGDFEGVANIAIGLSRAVCPSISVLSSPPRLVIQFPNTG